MYSTSPATPSARTNASQKVVSRKYCACTWNARSAMRSLGYPPSIALAMASWIVIAIPFISDTGDVGLSQPGALQIRLEFLHLVLPLGQCFRQLFLRPGEHGGFC